MNLNVCTISFRHQLISFKQIALWAKQQGFNGVELWGVHAKNMEERNDCDKDWLSKHGLAVPMISDYLPLDGDEKSAFEKAHDLGHLGVKWRARKIRTFAGGKASDSVNEIERRAWTKRLRTLCEIISAYELYLVVETHPNTLADTLDSTLRLIEEVNHPALRINFDVIHVWEAGDDVKKAMHMLDTLIEHVHLKNVSSREKLTRFKPENVYAPAGSREGMVELFDGVFDYADFMQYMKESIGMKWNRLDASLEWFGGNTISVLAKDKNAIERYGLGNQQFAKTSCGEAVSII